MRDTLENIKNAGTKIFVPAQAQGKNRTKRSPQKMMSPNLEPLRHTMAENCRSGGVGVVDREASASIARMLMYSRYLTRNSPARHPRQCGRKRDMHKDFILCQSCSTNDATKLFQWDYKRVWIIICNTTQSKGKMNLLIGGVRHCNIMQSNRRSLLLGM